MASEQRPRPWLVYLSPRWHLEVSTALLVVLIIGLIALALLAAGIGFSLSPLNEVSPAWAAWLGLGIGLVLVALGLRRNPQSG